MAKVYLSFFLVFIFLALSLSETQDLNLLVMDSNTKVENPKFLVKYVNDSLKLICELRDNVDDEIKLKWILPDQNRTFDDDDDIISNETSFDAFQNNGRRNESLKLYISHLKETDNGLYTCEANGNTTGTFNHTIKLFVKLKKVSCGQMFECEDSNCIAEIYKCDGHLDCTSGNDEAPELCGENPCEGRIRCSTGRCIPKEWCNACDSLKVNCTNSLLLHKHDCCHQIPPYAADIMGYGDGSHYRRSDMRDMEHPYDLKFIQTTIYTVIGCAIVFMIIVSMLVIAICRVHMKRSLPSNLPNNRRAFVTTAYRRACTQDLDLDISLNRVDVPGLLVTYNINNGVQIVGSPVEPPPYSEIASLPPREGPPPPYTLSQLYESPPNVRLLNDGTSAKPGRHGLSHARVSSEPSLLNVNRL